MSVNALGLLTRMVGDMTTAELDRWRQEVTRHHGAWMWDAIFVALVSVPAGEC